MLNPIIKLLVMKKYRVQADFANEVGASESRISRAINGRIKIRPDEAEKWAAAIGCEIETLAPITRKGGTIIEQPGITGIERVLMERTNAEPQEPNQTRP